MVVDTEVRPSGAETPSSDTPVARLQRRGFLCGELTEHDEFRAAAALYERAFGYSSDEFTLNANLLGAMTRNGGSAVGVVDPAREHALIGFAYGFSGRDENGNDFHYSQAAVVDEQYRGTGVGRALKYLQRDVALRWGHEQMRWAFDPLRTGNGHFNLSSLRGVASTYERNYYGRPGSDRLIVEWDLTGRDPHASLRELPPTVLAPADLTALRAPARASDGSVVGQWVLMPTSPIDERALAATNQLATLLESGAVAVACERVSSALAAYLVVDGPARKERGHGQH